MSIFDSDIHQQIRNSIIERHFAAIRRLAKHDRSLVEAQVEDLQKELRETVDPSCRVSLREKPGTFTDPGSCDDLFVVAKGPDFEFVLDVGGPAHVVVTEHKS